MNINSCWAVDNFGSVSTILNLILPFNWATVTGTHRKIRWWWNKNVSTTCNSIQAGPKILIRLFVLFDFIILQNHFTSIRWKSIWHRRVSVNWTQYCAVKLIGQLFTVLALISELAKYSRHRFQIKDPIYHCGKQEISQAVKRYVSVYAANENCVQLQKRIKRKLWKHKKKKQNPQVNQSQNK